MQTTSPVPENLPVPFPQSKNFIDRTGQRFGRLTATAYAGKRCRHHHWFCLCECGKKTVVSTSNLTRGTSKSCGCLHSEIVVKMNTTHGLFYDHYVEYIAWVNIRNRCRDPKNRYYKDYGGRGIEFWAGWNDFSVFFKDVGPRPGPGYSLDRIDNEKGYFPGNLRWATRFEQAANRRSTRLIEINGQSKPIMVWCREFRLKYQSVVRRFNNGYSPEEAFELISTPRNRRSVRMKTESLELTIPVTGSIRPSTLATSSVELDVGSLPSEGNGPPLP